MFYRIHVKLLYALTPSSNLSETPCDKRVQGFPDIHLDIVGGYRLHRVCSHCVWASCDSLSWHSCGRPGRSHIQASRKHAMSVQLCRFRSLRLEILLRPYDLRTENSRRWCGERAVAVFECPGTKSVKLHISACVVGFTVKPKAGMERGPRRTGAKMPAVTDIEHVERTGEPDDEEADLNYRDGLTSAGT